MLAAALKKEGKNALAKYILKRLGYAILTIWVVVTLTFIIMKVIPGNPFISDKMTKTTLENLMRFYKLDQPLFIQYLEYLKSVVTFNFGPSMVSATLDANFYITRGLPVSMQLGVQALLTALIFGMLLGVVAALNHNRWPDYISIIIAILGVSVPSFIMSRILTSFFSLKLGWFPVSGWDSMRSTVLPMIALAVLPMAQITRLTRSSMLEVMGMDYIKTARAKGISRIALILRHGVKNASLPIISSLGTITTNLVTGSIVIERIFAIPGMGESLVKSVGNRDYPVIMAATVVYSIILIALTLAIDLIYPFIDPRIKIVGGETVLAEE